MRKVTPKKIFAIIPAFNEEQRIAQVLKDIGEYVDQIIVIDDGSSDKTCQRVKHKKAVLLRHLFNLGQGAALQTGFSYAKNHGANIVVTFDADGQFNASEIPKLTKPILDGTADITLGSRFLGKTIAMPFSKLLILKLGIFFTWIYSGLMLTDTYNGFRALNKKALGKINFSQNRMGHAMEIIEQIKKYQLTFKEIPVTVSYDEYTKKKGQKASYAFGIAFSLITKKLY